MAKSPKKLTGKTRTPRTQRSVVLEEVSLSEKISQYEKQMYDLRQLLEISRSLCTTLELPTLIESILYTTMAQMHVLGAGIFIQETIDSTFYVLGNYYNGLDVDPAIEYKLPVTGRLVDILSNSGHAYTMGELKELAPKSKDVAFLDSLKPTLVIPLILKNRLNGILVLGERIKIDGSSSEYTEYEKDEIYNISSLAAIAVNNASLVEQSSTDMMTHLKLKYYFFNVLTDKLDSAYAQNQPLSVLMFDVDFFKKFNDNYGHACGDYVLQTVAEIIKTSIRSQDMASRYGGEEFTVMLVNTNKKEALRVAERIRKNVDSKDFFYEGQHLHITISGGASVFSTDTNPVTSAKVLVDQADQALYISKRNGRNRITYAEPAMLAAMGLPLMQEQSLSDDH